MRRGRDLRDYRDSLRRKAAEDRRGVRKRQARERLVVAREKRKKEKIHPRLAKRLGVIAQQPLPITFLPFDQYVCNREEPIHVCHVIESLGMGGGQTMMMELVNALEKYYPGKIINSVVCPRPAATQKFDKKLYQSYTVIPEVIQERKLGQYLVNKKCQIVLQHRLALSKCLKPLIPSNVKYVLLNHTYHQLAKLSNFVRCDFYISVCNYLHKNSRWTGLIDETRCIVILNGVEDDYIESLQGVKLEGDFKTGRCHRLVQSKFRADSLKWQQNVAKNHIPGYTHYLVGYSAEAKRLCKKLPNCYYVGSTPSRGKKMGIIRNLDVYFYETFQQEGASIAILEALACGVPVLCKNYGGCPELITNGVNGYILKDRPEFLQKMKELSVGDGLQKLKESTRKDFQERLHIKFAACKYMQVFEKLV